MTWNYNNAGEWAAVSAVPVKPGAFRLMYRIEVTAAGTFRTIADAQLDLVPRICESLADAQDVCESREKCRAALARLAVEGLSVTAVRLVGDVT